MSGSPQHQRHIEEQRQTWFASAGPREDDLRRVDALIRENAPDMAPVISGQMLGYGTIAYQPRSARVPTDLPVLSLANQKHHISLYAHSMIDGEYVAELYADRLVKVSCGKSCIRFTRLDDIDRDRMLAAQAMIESLTMITKDTAFANLPGVRTLW